MNTKQKHDQLPWLLIISLGLFALVRPVIKVFGDVFDYNVSVLATILITIVIAVVWVGVAVGQKVKKPVIVLALSGVTYGVLSIAMAAIIQLTVPGLGDSEAKIPIILTVGLIATTIFNLVYGAFLGFVALMIQKVAKR